MEYKYNVYIVEIATGKAVGVTGMDMSEKRAEKRVMTTLSMVNRKEYFVDMVDVDSEDIKKYNSDLHE